MTNEHILHLASRANYAHICIDRSCIIGNGQESWETQLPQLTELQRTTLIAKLNRWKAMLSKENARQAIVTMVGSGYREETQHAR